MRWQVWWQISAAAVAALASASPAAAVDTAKCGAAMVCASKPETIVAALQAAGYKAKASVDSTGDPSIESAASGYRFDIYFYGCKNHVDCSSLQFQISWGNDPIHTPALANEWNRKERFAQASIGDKHQFVVSYDVTTVGGINQKNFADTIDWWQTMLNDLQTFWRDHPSAEPADPVNAT